MKRIGMLSAAVVAAAAVATGASAQGQVEVNPAFLAIFKPSLPARIERPDAPATEAQIDLGRMLYYDTRLSVGQDISCNTCHDLAHYGVDVRERRDVSLGHQGQPGTRNAPTVYNAASHIAQFWDGRAATVEDQAQMPITNPVEMAMPENDHVVTVLKSIPGYVEAFKKAFPDDSDPITMANLGRAIGAFERGLTTPGPWDRFVDGDNDALTDAQKAGFNMFISVGCLQCHMGPYFGGNMYMKLGQINPWPNQEDQGRFDVVGGEANRMMFKSPGLRNVTETGPYFHDGSEASLTEAIKLMAWHQLGRKLTDAEAQSIADFFGALKGEIPTDYIKEPQLPASGPNTPGPAE